MKPSLFSLTLLCVLACCLGACRPKPAAVPSEAELIGVVQENLRAMEAEDAEAVQKTVHPKSPAYASTGAIVQMLFDLVEVKYQLSDLKVLAATPEEAQVSFVQRMEKVGGDGPFQNNIVTGVHTLRPDRGQWKIFATRQTKVTDLEGKPLPGPETTEPTPPDTTPAAVGEKPNP